MRKMILPSLQLITLMTLVGMASCRGKTAHPTAPSLPPASGQASAAHHFDGSSYGIAFDWPAGWHQEPDDSYELKLTPDDKPKDVEVSLDVPDLPPHLPGMIPLGMVKNGYVKDLKKKMSNMTVAFDREEKVHDAKAQRVRCEWTKDGVKWSETALLMVHDDHVYIIRGTTDQAHEAPTQTAFDAVEKSIQWVK